VVPEFNVHEHLNTYRAHPWSPFPLRGAHPGPGPHTLQSQFEWLKDDFAKSIRMAEEWLSGRLKGPKCFKRRASHVPAIRIDFWKCLVHVGFLNLLFFFITRAMAVIVGRVSSWGFEVLVSPSIRLTKNLYHEMICKTIVTSYKFPKNFKTSTRNEANNYRHRSITSHRKFTNLTAPVSHSLRSTLVAPRSNNVF